MGGHGRTVQREPDRDGSKAGAEERDERGEEHRDTDGYAAAEMLRHSLLMSESCERRRGRRRRKMCETRARNETIFPQVRGTTK